MSEENENKTEVSDFVGQASDDFVKSMTNWCKGLHLWAQRAVVRYFETQNPEDLNISKEFSEWVTAELDGKQKDPGTIDTSTFNLQYPLTTLRYLSISDVKGVNAIDTSQDQPLLFGKDGLTLVYGMNGSGKSGYMRMFRKIAGKSNDEKILGNIYKEEDIQPSCAVTIWNGINEKAIPFKLDQNSRPLPYIDVFDGRSSDSFIQEGKDLTYLPRLVGLFSFLADSADFLRQSINERIASLNKSMPEISIPEISSNTPLGRKLGGIDAATKILDTEKTWDEVDQRAFKSLESFMKSGNKEAEIKLNRTQTHQLEAVLFHLRPVAASLSEEKIQTLNSMKRDYLIARERRDDAASLLGSICDDLDKEDISQDSWKAMWRAVHDYAKVDNKKSKDEAPFDSICPLCHQKIKEPTQKRMSVIDDFVCGHLAKDAERRKQSLDKAVSTFSPSAIDAIRISATGIETIIGEEAYARLQFEFGELDALYKLLLSGADKEVKRPSIVEVGMAIKERKMELEEKRRLLQSSMESTEYKKAQDDYTKLMAKRFCNRNIDSIVKAIDIQKAIARQETARKYFDTRKYTIKAGEVADKVITEPYIESFNKELKAFSGTRNIKVTLEPRKAGKGRIGHQIVLKSAGGTPIATKNVLSDGEIRVVSIAAFLAEAMQRNPNGILVFDDPISSLDLEYEEEFSRRIVDAAKKSQVIVFSHRLSLMYELSTLCVNHNVTYTESHLCKTQHTAGIPRSGDIRTKKLKAAINVLIDQQVTEVKKLDPLTTLYESAITGIEGDLRVLIERCIEETLLYGVVTRFKRNVSTQKIKCLAGITNDDCSFIDNLMSKYSTPIHSQSCEAPKQHYTIDEIEKDAMMLKDWNKKVAERNESVQRR